MNGTFITNLDMGNACTVIVTTSKPDRERLL